MQVARFRVQGLLFGWAVLALSFSGPAARAQEKVKSPEAYLSADSIFYLHYDGSVAHRAAYDKTALAKVMKEDLGEFLDYVGPQLLELCFGGAPFFFPQINPRLEKMSAAFSRAASHVAESGLVMAIEVPEKAAAKIVGRRELFRIEGAQATVVFPSGGLEKNRSKLVPFFLAMAGAGEWQVRDKKVRERAMQLVDAGDYRATWWTEGDHLVLTLGWLPVEHTLDVIEGKKPNVTSLAVHKSMAEFKGYETNLRGHADMEKVVDILRTPPDNGKPFEMIKHALKRGLVLNQLGLTGLKSLSFHCGFEGQYHRSTVIQQVVEPKERPGLMRLVSGPATFDPKNLPPIPPDAASVRVHHVDWTTTGDILFGLLKLKDLATAFDGVPFRGQFLHQLSGLDYDFRQEILPHLDSTLVAYNALSEGPLILGQVVAIKVKDPVKLRAGLEGMNRALQRGPDKKDAKQKAGIDDAAGLVSLLQPEGRQGFRKRNYRGTDIFVWEGRDGRFFPEFLPLSYAIHNGWLVLSPFPQAVKGHIMRSGGKYKVWEAPPISAQALALAKKAGGPNSKLVSVHVSDPRPTVEVALALTPLFLHLTRMFERRFGEDFFDISRVPNAQSVTEWLLPNVTVMFDDGNALRWETHSTLSFPLEDLFYFVILGGIFA